MTDRDAGDMLLNFQLHRSVVPFTGVKLSLLYERRWAVWDRNLMGFAALPYNSIKMALVVEEICKGNRHEEGVGIDEKGTQPISVEAHPVESAGVKGVRPVQIMDINIAL